MTTTSARPVPSRVRSHRGRGVPPGPPAPDSRRSIASYIAIAGLFLLAFAGYIKGSPLVQQYVPFDLTVIAAIVVAVSVVLRAPSMLTSSVAQALGLILALWVTFFIGVAGSHGNPYANSKILGLFTFSLLCAVGAVFLLHSAQARSLWLGLTVAMGVLIAIMAVVYPDAVVAASGRLAVEGSNTIGSARATGAAVVVLAAFALTDRRRRMAAVGLALALGVVMIATGSRGPLLAAVAAMVVVAIVPAARGRVKRLVLGAIIVAAIALLADRAGVYSQRFSSVDGFLSSAARSELWREAGPVILAHPWGIGWGDLYPYLGGAALDSGWVQYPHNIFLEVVSESSWLAGLGLLIVLLTAFFRQAAGATRAPAESAMLGLLAFYLICAMVSGDVNDNRGVWVMSAAALVALSAPTAGRAARGSRRSPASPPSTR